MNQYYQRIAELCRQAGVTVGKMCTDLNIRQSVLSDLKAGRTKTLSTETLTKIANYFNTSMDVLLGNSVPEVGTITEEDRALLSAYQQAAPELRAAVRRVLGLE